LRDYFSKDIKMRWITSVSTVIEAINKMILLVVLLAVGTVLCVGVVRLWWSGSNRITIVSFTDSSADAGGDKSTDLSRMVTNVLEFEMRRINELHTVKSPWGSAPGIPSQEGSSSEGPMLEMTGSQIVERIGGKINFAGIEFPLEMVLEAMKPLLPRPRKEV
jgi:hypothetical protein